MSEEALVYAALKKLVVDGGWVAADATSVVIDVSDTYLRPPYVLTPEEFAALARLEVIAREEAEHGH